MKVTTQLMEREWEDVKVTITFESLGEVAELHDILSEALGARQLYEAVRIIREERT